VKDEPANKCKDCNALSVWHCAHPEECKQIAIRKYALITPSINNSLVEEESQEDIWMQVITECANTAEKVGAVRLIESLTSQFTVTRKK
jgi:hypothetical protein